MYVGAFYLLEIDVVFMKSQIFRWAEEVCEKALCVANSCNAFCPPIQRFKVGPLVYYGNLAILEKHNQVYIFNDFASTTLVLETDDIQCIVSSGRYVKPDRIIIFYYR